MDIEAIETSLDVTVIVPVLFDVNETFFVPLLAETDPEVSDSVKVGIAFATATVQVADAVL